MGVTFTAGEARYPGTPASQFINGLCSCIGVSRKTFREAEQDYRNTAREPTLFRARNYCQWCNSNPAKPKCPNCGGWN